MKVNTFIVVTLTILLSSHAANAQQPYPYPPAPQPVQGDYGQDPPNPYQPQPSNYPPNTYGGGYRSSERDPHRFHVLLGMSAAPYLLYDAAKTDEWYLGVAALPEIRAAYSLDRIGYARVFVSAKWSALSTTTLLKNNPDSVAAEPVRNLEFMGIGGVTVVPSPEGPARTHLSTSVTGFSLGVGYGSARTSLGTIIRGPVIMLSIDLELLAFNFM